jgi:hypothetical protein
MRIACLFVSAQSHNGVIVQFSAHYRTTTSIALPIQQRLTIKRTVCVSTTIIAMGGYYLLFLVLLKIKFDTKRDAFKLGTDECKHGTNHNK